MYGINDTVYNNLIKYFEKNNKIYKVVLFGSRAKGSERINSDIDLCIDCVDEGRGTLVEEINDLVGIYSCDILFFNSLNNEIKNQILRDGITIYSNSSL